MQFRLAVVSIVRNRWSLHLIQIESYGQVAPFICGSHRWNFRWVESGKVILQKNGWQC
jgi:hypothetical protein